MHCQITRYYFTLNNLRFLTRIEFFLILGIKTQMHGSKKGF